MVEYIELFGKQYNVTTLEKSIVVVLIVAIVIFLIASRNFYYYKGFWNKNHKGWGALVVGSLVVMFICGFFKGYLLIKTDILKKEYLQFVIEQDYKIYINGREVAADTININGYEDIKINDDKKLVIITVN